MSLWELLLIAIGLSMDAFAVAICRGLEMRKINYKHAGLIALFFGVFQAAMPLIGYFLGSSFQSYIENYDHWMAFLLLAAIGGHMILEAGHCEEEKYTGALNVKYLTVMAFATSVDALVVGLTFAFLKVNILWSVSLIGITTFILSFLGVCVGNRFGARYKSKAEIAGGVVLILIGLKILLEHLGVLNL